MSLPGGWELILVVIVIMVLFGYKKLPDATRSLGRSMRIFKAETKGLRTDDAATTTDAPAALPPAQPVQATQPVQPVQPVQAQPVQSAQAAPADPVADPARGADHPRP